MTHLNDMTAADLAAYFAQLTGKTIKPGSYSKAAWMAKVEKADQDVTDAAPLEELDLYGRGHDEDTARCPHCGINHIDNGYQTAENLEGNHDLTREFICLACNGEWGPEIKASSDFKVEGPTFTLAQIARHMGITPKAARAKYRRIDNDGVRTRYVFENTQPEINRVAGIIGRKGE